MNRWNEIINNITNGKKYNQISYPKIRSKPPAIASSRRSYGHCFQNFRLVWLDSNIDNSECITTITELRQVINTVETFTDVDECIDFITDLHNEDIFMITSGTLGQTTVPVLNDIDQINSLYIFCRDKVRHEQWANQWPKIQGVYTNITQICEILTQAVQDCDQNSVSISFAQKTDDASNTNLDELKPLFMYTQIFKEILLTIDFQQSHINEFLTCCREELLVDNAKELRNVDKIEQEYPDRQPIWWYTYHCFLYSMLNKALRTMEVDRIIKMGFFIRDLHQHIAELHSKQYGEHPDTASFTVYRCQELPQIDFNDLKKRQGGLFSFNNFLSTSKKRKVSEKFAPKKVKTSDRVGILFIIEIDPSIRSPPFANVQDVSAYPKEDEILFSMHSIFRIGEIKQLDENNNHLWEVKLTLTSDTDPQLHNLTEYIRKETFTTEKGWCRLGNLLITLGHFDKAEQVCNIILDQTTDELEEASIYHMLGMVKYDQRKYKEAADFYNQSIKIKQKMLNPTHLYLASSYNSIGLVYTKMGKHSKAFSSYEKAFKIKKNTLPSDHPNLATSYDNMGLAYGNVGVYSQALLYHEEALAIRERHLPQNHPDFAQSYSNIGSVYYKARNYEKALSYHEKALEIRQRTLPPDHPDFSQSYNNIGSVYDNMRKYSKALPLYEHALKIKQRSLSPNHRDIKVIEKKIKTVKQKL